MSARRSSIPSPAARVLWGLVVALVLAIPPAAADEALPLGNYLQRLRAALSKHPAAGAQPRELTARVTAESRSGVRRLRIRDFQFISDSQRSFAGYNLGAGSWDTQVGVLGSAVANEFLVQAAIAGIELDAVDVVFTSHQDPPGAGPRSGVSYPRNLRYEAYLVSSASDAELETLRQKVESSSPVLNLVSQQQDIPHGQVIYTPSPVADPDAPPGLREFLVEKRAAILRRQRGSGGPRESPTLRAHVRVEGGTGLKHVRVGDNRFQFLHDTPRSLAGFDLGPTVEEHQLGVMGTCLTHIFEIQAADRQVPLDALSIEVKGTLTSDARQARRLRDVRYTVSITSPASAAEIDELRKAVESVCPIYNLLKDRQTISGRVIRARYEPRAAESTAAMR